MTFFEDPPELSFTLTERHTKAVRACLPCRFFLDGVSRISGVCRPVCQQAEGLEKMSLAWRSWGTALLLAASVLAVTEAARAQQNVPRIALKSGESTELRDFFYIANCVSVLNGATTIDILDSPSEISLAIRDKMVLPRGNGCAKEVAGGSVVATAGTIDEPKEGKLTFRLNFKTKMGPRQISNTYIVSLFP